MKFLIEASQQYDIYCFTYFIVYYYFMDSDSFILATGCNESACNVVIKLIPFEICLILINDSVDWIYSLYTVIVAFTKNEKDA